MSLVWWRICKINKYLNKRLPHLLNPPSFQFPSSIVNPDRDQSDCKKLLNVKTVLKCLSVPSDWLIPVLQLSTCHHGPLTHTHTQNDLSRNCCSWIFSDPRNQLLNCLSFERERKKNTVWLYECKVLLWDLYYFFFFFSVTFGHFSLFFHLV